jgi:hypothetical protein
VIGKLVSVAALVALTGCAHPVWIKGGASQQDFATDSYECERDSRQSGYYGSGLAGAVNMQGFMNRCMEARSWRLAPQNGTAEVASTGDVDFREGASKACIMAGIQPGTPGYYQCFQQHLRSR